MFGSKTVGFTVDVRGFVDVDTMFLYKEMLTRSSTGFLGYGFALCEFLGGFFVRVFLFLSSVK